MLTSCWNSADADFQQMIPEVENTEKSLQVWQQMLKMEANISIETTSANKLVMFIILELSHTFYSAKDFFSPNFQFLLGIEKTLKMRRIGHLQPVTKKHGLIELPLCKPAASEHQFRISNRNC